MSTFEELKNAWEATKDEADRKTALDQPSLNNIIKSRTKKNVNTAIKYFWASFFLQILVYALLAHVIIKFGYDIQILIAGLLGIALFIPFTFTLMKKFKGMAVTRLEGGISGASIQRYVERQHMLLNTFYKFKKRYEIVLVPLATAIGTYLTFQLYVPGGVTAYLTAALMIFSVSLFACAIAVVRENRRNFEQPLRDLRQIMEEFKND